MIGNKGREGVLKLGVGMLRKREVMEEFVRGSETESSGGEAEKGKTRLEILEERQTVGDGRKAWDTVEEKRRSGNGSEKCSWRGGDRTAQTETSLSQGHIDL